MPYRADLLNGLHDSGVGIESAVKRWSSVDEGVLTPIEAFDKSQDREILDLKDLRDLTGRLDLGHYPVASGGYADVWKATLNSTPPEERIPSSLAVKVLRARADDRELQRKVQRVSACMIGSDVY
jgi:hypothetical protein